MSKDPQENLWQEIVYGINHDAFCDPMSQAALKAYQIGASNHNLDLILRHRVQKIRNAEALGQYIPFRKPDLKQQELCPGVDTDNNPIGLKIQWLNAHVFFGANAGSGKSTLIKCLALQVAPQLKGFWLSDMYKSELRHLRPPLKTLGVDLLVIRDRKAKLNILQPVCNPHSHLAMIADVLTRLLDMPPRSNSIVRGALYSLYSRFGVFEGNTKEYPCLFDLEAEIRKTQMNSSAKSAILDRLTSLLIALTPEIAGYRKAWSPKDLANHRIVFEFRGMAEHAKTVLISYLLFSTLYSRAEYCQPNSKLDLVVAFEDSQRFFSTSTVSSSELPPLDEVVGIIRGTGVSVWGSCQTMHNVSKGLLPNLSTKFMGRMGSHEDYSRLGADMGMSREQITWAKLNLRPGMFIAQIAEGTWRLPFVLKVPPINMPYSVSDSEADSSLNSLRYLPTIPAEEFRNWRPDYSLSREGFTSTAVDKEEGEEVEVLEDKSPLSPNELRLLRAIVNNPGQHSTVYPKLAQMNAAACIEARATLLEKELIEEHALNTNARGRPAIVLLPTQKGIDLFG